MKKRLNPILFWALLFSALLSILLISGAILRARQTVGAVLYVTDVEVTEKHRENGKQFITIQKRGEASLPEDAFFLNGQTIRVTSADLYETIQAHRPYAGVSMSVQIPMVTANKTDGLLDDRAVIPTTYFLGPDGEYLNLSRLFQDPEMVKEYVVLHQIGSDDGKRSF